MIRALRRRWQRDRNARAQGRFQKLVSVETCPRNPRNLRNSPNNRLLRVLQVSQVAVRAGECCHGFPMRCRSVGAFLLNQVLTNPTYRENARKMQRAIAEANGLSVAADLVEKSVVFNPFRGMLNIRSGCQRRRPIYRRRRQVQPQVSNPKEVISVNAFEGRKNPTLAR